MSENSNEQPDIPSNELDLATAKSTYKIITTLLEHIDASANLIALMASALGAEPTKKITETGAWANFLGARKSLESIQPDLQRFVHTVNRLIEIHNPDNKENTESNEPPSQ